MTKATEQISSAIRRVSALSDDRGEVRTVTISRVYDASVDEVWDACTKPERIARWFLPVTADPRVGGRYQLEGNAGGTINECRPPARFSATWEFADEVSWIELNLVGLADNRTSFELAHTVPADEKWTDFGPGAVGPGWDLALVGFAAYLAAPDSGHDLPPELSDPRDRHDAIRLSSSLWHEANISAGANPEQAQKAADRTTEFWCAPPPESVTHVGMSH